MTTLPPLAEVSDLAAWVGQAIPDADPRAGAVLSHVSTRVRAYTKQDFADNIPDVVRDVVVRVAARVWNNPEGLDSVTLDDGTKRWGSVRGLEFADDERDDLAPYCTVTTAPTGLGVVGTYRGDARRADTVYVPTGPQPSGGPFPWYSSDDPGIN